MASTFGTIPESEKGTEMKTIETGKHAGCVRGFIHSTEAWYHRGKTSVLDEVLFGFYAPEGGTTGEMRVVWRELGRDIVPELTVFDDAWAALAEFGDLLALMSAADAKHVTGKQFCEMLVQCRFVDMTERVEGERPWLQKA